MPCANCGKNTMKTVSIRCGRNPGRTVRCTSCGRKVVTGMGGPRVVNQGMGYKSWGHNKRNWL